MYQVPEVPLTASSESEEELLDMEAVWEAAPLGTCGTETDEGSDEGMDVQRESEEWTECESEDGHSEDDKSMDTLDTVPTKTSHSGVLLTDDAPTEGYGYSQSESSSGSTQSTATADADIYIGKRHFCIAHLAKLNIKFLFYNLRTCNQTYLL